jgi:hypothetical protein
MSRSTANPTKVEHRSRDNDRDRRSEMTARARPPFDVELEPALDAVPAFFTTLESVTEFRAATTRPASLDDPIAERPVEVTDHARDGVTAATRSSSRCCGAVATGVRWVTGVYLIHGGGRSAGADGAVAPMLVQ